MKSQDELEEMYRGWWDGAVIKESSRQMVTQAARRAELNRERIAPVARAESIPWMLIAALMELEASGRMDRHIANGERLTHRTKLVPEGEPPDGDPPWTWEDAATQELRLIVRPVDGVWTLEAMLYAAEKWNGMGPRNKGRRSPYLVAQSELEQQGKYTSDHHYDPQAWSDQVGALTLWRFLVLNDGLELLAEA